MAGTCVTAVKVVGVTSLGLLTSSLTYQATQEIPTLINRLRARAALSSASDVLAAISTNISFNRAANVVLGGLSLLLLWAAFKASSPSEQHPYLIYSAVGAPIAVGSLYYRAFKHEKRLKRATGRRAARRVPPPSLLLQKEVIFAQKDSDEDLLGKSYIHVSDEESSTNTSTPESLAPVSPIQQAHQEAEADLKEELSIEQEVEDALHKKEYMADLAHLRSSYAVGAAISGAGFLVAFVGLIGDFFLL